MAVSADNLSMPAQLIGKFEPLRHSPSDVNCSRRYLRDSVTRLRLFDKVTRESFLFLTDPHLSFVGTTPLNRTMFIIAFGLKLHRRNFLFVEYE